MCALYDADEPLVGYPTELIDDNKIRAARRGIDGKLVDFHHGGQVRRRRWRSGWSDARPARRRARLRDELESSATCSNGTGAQRQLAILERGDDLRDLVADIADHTRP